MDTARLKEPGTLTLKSTGKITAQSIKQSKMTENNDIKREKGGEQRPDTHTTDKAKDRTRVTLAD